MAGGLVPPPVLNIRSHHTGSRLYDLVFSFLLPPSLWPPCSWLTKATFASRWAALGLRVWLQVGVNQLGQRRLRRPQLESQLRHQLQLHDHESPIYVLWPQCSYL